MKDLDHFYLQKEEPVKSCLQAMREIILGIDKNMTEAWKYKMPFFCYKKKMICYLWIHKKTNQPYLGLVDGTLIDHPQLIIENRSRMKIMMLDAQKDLPIRTIRNILKTAIDLRNVKTK